MDSDDSDLDSLPPRKVLHRRVKKPKYYADFYSADDPEVLQSAGDVPAAKRGQSLKYDELFTDESSLSSLEDEDSDDASVFYDRTTAKRGFDDVGMEHAKKQRLHDDVNRVEPSRQSSHFRTFGNVSSQQRCYKCARCLRQNCGRCLFCLNRSEMGQESKLKFCIERRCERMMTREPGDIDVNKLRAQLRCGECDNCRRKDCGKCLFCLDNPKFGGPNRFGKECAQRRCKAVGDQESGAGDHADEGQDDDVIHPINQLLIKEALGILRKMQRFEARKAEAGDTTDDVSESVKTEAADASKGDNSQNNGDEAGSSVPSASVTSSPAVVERDSKTCNISGADSKNSATSELQDNKRTAMAVSETIKTDLVAVEAENVSVSNQEKSTVPINAMKALPASVTTDTIPVTSQPQSMVTASKSALAVTSHSATVTSLSTSTVTSQPAAVTAQVSSSPQLEETEFNADDVKRVHELISSCDDGDPLDVLKSWIMP